MRRALHYWSCSRKRQVHRGDCRSSLSRVCAFVGPGSADVALRAQQLLEHSLLSELRAVVARTLAGEDMFTAAQLAELLGTTDGAAPDSSHSQDDDKVQPASGTLL